LVSQLGLGFRVSQLGLGFRVSQLGFSAWFPHPLWELLGDSEKIDDDLCEVVLELKTLWSQLRDQGLPHLSHNIFLS
jgi:hypothetical protein